MNSSSNYSNDELIHRYKEQYRIPEDVKITIEMVLRHWELELLLTRKLKESTFENRWEIFNYCYTKLYNEIKWLNLFVEKSNVQQPNEEFKRLIQTIGPPPKCIYEIGPGKGRLISHLASLGYECRATEITNERGKKHVFETNNVSWSRTDGIHLDRFEKKNHYDIVISNDVIEHLHPDDIEEHFFGVYQILKLGGSYVFSTPHQFFGPWDISRVFGREEPQGMHLKEYKICEVLGKLRKTGFKEITFPSPIFSSYYHKLIPFSKNEVAWISFLERILANFPRNIRRCFINKRRIFPITKIFLIATKSGA